MNEEMIIDKNLSDAKASEKKTTELFSLRVSSDKKEILESFKKSVGGTGDTVAGKIIELIANEKINEKEKRLNLSNDVESLEKSISDIIAVIRSVDAKSNQQLNDIVRDCNIKLEEKDIVLKESKAAIDAMNVYIEEMIDKFKEENTAVAQELKDTQDRLEQETKAVEDLQEQFAKKEIDCSNLLIEKNKLLAEVQAHIELSTKQIAEINSLKDLEDINKELKDSIESLKDDIRQRDSDISIAKNTINAKESELASLKEDIKVLKETVQAQNNEISIKKDDINVLTIDLNIKTKELEALTDSNNNIKKELESIKTTLAEKESYIVQMNEDFRNEIANLTIEHKESLLNEKERCKDEAEKKYESKIERLKEEIFKLRAENAALMKKSK